VDTPKQLPAEDALASLRHEFHNRVAVVSGFSALLLEQLDRLTPEEVREWLSRVAANAAELPELLEAWAQAASARGAPTETAGRRSVSAGVGSSTAAAMGSTEPGEAGRVLLVEDNDDHVALVRSLLSAHQGRAWELVRAGSLGEARRLVDEADPACCLLDLTLPDASGLEALTELRAAAPTRPIVVVTGDHDQRLGVAALRHGAQDFLVKEEMVGDVLERSILHAIERMRVERGLASQAFHDPLTGLPNRLLLLDRLQLALSRLDRHPSLVAAIFIDLDRFKRINDTLGHRAGDEALVAVAERLRSVVRTSDTVARFGGDEFVILCEDLVDESDAIRIAEHVHAQFAAPADGADGTQFVTASVGVAVATLPTVPAQSLLSDADAAMYRAKERGGAQWELFDQTTRARVASRFATDHDLRQALRWHQLHLAYQPLVELSTGRVAGVEAQLRWHHPTRGILPASEFLPVAEQSGQITEIGAWVLEEACAQARRWQRAGLADHDFVVWAQVWAGQLERPGLADAVALALSASGLPADRLGLQIAESVLMNDLGLTASLMASLRRLELCLGVNEFGTGFSSISWLGRLPIDQLKIDGTLIHDLGRHPDESATVAACVGVARALGKTAAATGVGTADQAEALVSLGCSLGQGDFLGRPKTSDETTELLARPRA
jgi:diguanylate cyclase (GGDEF)-like protein